MIKKLKKKIKKKISKKIFNNNDLKIYSDLIYCSNLKLSPGQTYSGSSYPCTNRRRFRTLIHECRLENNRKLSFLSHLFYGPTNKEEKFKISVTRLKIDYLQIGNEYLIFLKHWSSNLGGSNLDGRTSGSIHGLGRTSV